MATVTHRLDDELKQEFDRFCNEHGLKQQAVLQEALATWLEDARDAEFIEERRNGPWVDWDHVQSDL